MDVVLINRRDSKFEPQYETFSLPPLLLMFDYVIYLSPVSMLFADYKRRNKWSNDVMLALYAFFGLDKESDGIKLDNLKKMIDNEKWAKKVKHKPKQMLVAMQSTKRLMDSLRKTLISKYEMEFARWGLAGVFPYVDDEVFVPFFSPEHLENVKMVNPFIEPIVNTFAADSIFQVFARQIEDLMPFVLLDQKNKPDESKLNEAAFLSVDFFQFPRLTELSHKQFDYTKENLCKKLNPFKEKTEELLKSLKTVSFEKENYGKIIEAYKQYIEPLIEPLQRSIDEELYIQQAKQMHSESVKVKFYLGMISGENVINCYEKAGIIKPNTVVEIKKQLSDIINLKEIRLFVYGKLIN